MMQKLFLLSALVCAACSDQGSSADLDGQALSASQCHNDDNGQSCVSEALRDGDAFIQAEVLAKKISGKLQVGAMPEDPGPATVSQPEHDGAAPHFFEKSDIKAIPEQPATNQDPDEDLCKREVFEHGGVDGAGLDWLKEQCSTLEFRDRCESVCEATNMPPPPPPSNDTAMLVDVATQRAWNCRSSYGRCSCQSGYSCYYVGSSSSYCWTDGCGEASSGANGRWCYCEDRALTTVSTPSESSGTSGAVTVGHYTVTGEGCVASGRCVRSNYPTKYGNYEGCSIKSSSVLYVANFRTESYYDKLYVNGNVYSGHSNPGNLGTPGTITWTSDVSIEDDGWKICTGCRCPSTYPYCYKTNGYCYASPSSSSWSDTCAGKCTNSHVREYKNFYNIGHMTNRISEVDWAIANGANAVELDINYDDDGNNGATPKWTWHGQPCDCSCLSFSTGLCGQVGGSCNTWEYLDDMLAHIATTDLELLELDNKVTTDYAGYDFKKALDSNKMTEAGQRLANKVIDQLLKKGFGGRVLVGGPSSLHFLKGAKGVFDDNGYEGRIYYSVDGDDGGNGVGYDVTKEKLLEIDPTLKHVAFVNGISACKTAIESKIAYLPALTRAVTDGFPIVIGWSIDYGSDAQTFINSGVNGFITNYPDVIKYAASSKGKLA